MLRIRFSRTGRRNRASFKIVLAENTFPVKGRFIEQLGSYDPHLKKAVIKKERVLYWLEKGAQVSDSVYNLFIKEGVLEGEKRRIRIKSSSKAKGEQKEEKQEIEQQEKVAEATSESEKSEGLAEKNNKEDQSVKVEKKEESAEKKTEQSHEQVQTETEKGQ